MRVKSLLIVALLLTNVIVLAGSSHARIDPKSIAGAWLFDEDKGDVAEDFSGSGHDGEFVGDVKWVPGKFGSALEFGAGGNDFVRVPNHDNLNVETFTLVAWVNVPATTGNWQTVVNKFVAGDHYGLWLRPDTGVVHHAHNPGGSNQIIESKTSVTDGKWHHIAGTFDGKVKKVYVDGVFEGELQTDLKPGGKDADVTIGTDVRGASVQLVGAIDEVAIFKVALSEDDIKSIMNEGLVQALAVGPSGKLATTWASVKMPNE